ncbi:MAG: DNA repair protein RecN [Bacteroidota bacterium]|nr:DNA repair protein RecN [Bacteroidota bacterium]
MLRKLHITNYLLMEELDLPLHEGLSILTGETGSGKSIVIGALALAMGERADVAVLRDPLKRCVIELEADLEELSMQSWFDRNELPFERYTLIRRQLEPNGRSRAFINDTPVKLEQLRELGAQLVHIHSQHHTLLLNDPIFQLGMIDHSAGEAKNAANYAAQYRSWRASLKELEDLRSESARSAAELDFLRFQLNELEEASLKADEQQVIEQELSRAENAGEIMQALTSVSEGMADQRGALGLISQLHRSLVKTARIDQGIEALLNRLASVQIELKDIAAEAEELAAKVEIDPAQAERLRERLDLILRLQQKHRVKSNEELLLLQEDLAQRVAVIGSMDEKIPHLEKQEAELKKNIIDQAKALSKARSKSAGVLSDQVEKILHRLGMEHAVFNFDHRVLEEPGTYGMDSIKAMFSANKDRSPSPLDKVASGGELSRVMLALISLSAASRSLPTVIFDEIDTGVSGEVADKVGTLMARMGKDRQILAITHLPQIASKAGHHMLVTKETKEGTVRSKITLLDHAQRVEAIAQMLSGRKLTKAALENAKVLLEQR